MLLTDLDWHAAPGVDVSMKQSRKRIIGLLALFQLSAVLGVAAFAAAPTAAHSLPGQAHAAAGKPEAGEAPAVLPAWLSLLSAALSAALGAGAAIIAHRIQQVPDERWKRAEYVRKAFQERYDSPGARNASFLLYWPDRHIPLWLSLIHI